MLFFSFLYFTTNITKNKNHLQLFFFSDEKNYSHQKTEKMYLLQCQMKAKCKSKCKSTTNIHNERAYICALVSFGIGLHSCRIIGACFVGKCNINQIIPLPLKFLAKIEI